MKSTLEKNVAHYMRQKKGTAAGRQNGGNHCQGTGTLQQPRYMRGGREVQEGGEMCTRMANSC